MREKEAKVSRDRAAKSGRRPALSSPMRTLAGLLLLGLVSACTYRGATDTAATLKLTWFSYLNGDDIRAGCRPGRPLHYRLIYNADYENQVRSYELTGDAGGGALMQSRVQSGSGLELSDLDFSDIAGWGGWRRAQSRLSPDTLQDLGQSLVDSGAFRPAPTGLRLYSDEYYWVATLCHDGIFYFNAWLYPSPRYDLLTFPERLYRQDATGMPVLPPKIVGPEKRLKRASGGGKPNFIFEMRVGERGFVGLNSL